jgi:heme-degrading monooxygenase HmoA
MTKVVEFIRVRPRAGVSAEMFLAAARKADGLFARMPGLLRRSLLGPDEAGLYTDVVEWRDEASAIASQKTAHEEPAEAAEYFGLVDMASMSFQRLRVQIESVHAAG